MSELYRPVISKALYDMVDKPIVLSILYDLDLLPEQLESQKEMTIGLFSAYCRLEGFLLAFKAMEIVKEDKPSESVMRHLVKRMYDECGTTKADEFIRRVEAGEHDVMSPWGNR